VIVSAFDRNQLMRADAPVKVDKIDKPGEHVDKTINMKAILPPPDSQTPEDKQYSLWQHQYDEECGVDLRVDFDWGGKAADAPLNEHQLINNVYQGYGSSQPWDEGKPRSTDRLCDDKNCVSLTKVAQSICKQLRGKVVGYAFYIGNKAVHKTGAYGLAKTAADPPEAAFTPHTKMQIASTSKVLTGLATVRMMKDLQNGATIDNTIFSTLPSDWQSLLPAGHLVRSIKFRELVSQKSGVQQYYARSNPADYHTLQDYDSLKQFFTQPIANPNAAPQCGSTTNPIISKKSPCYTDTNFGLMRVLLARANGLNSTDPQALGERYVKIVQDNVLTPVGVSASCTPPANGELAFPYTLDATVPGFDWGDLTANCGDWGWYLSVDDYGPVLDSLNAGDGKILTECQFNDVEINAKLGPNPSMNVPADHGIGFDCRSAGECGLPGGYRWLEKNGGDGWDQTDSSGHRHAGTQTTSVAIFGGKNGCGSAKPTPGVVGVLFINSPILNSNNGADTTLWQAFLAGVGPK
jgi:CubicO group peptidase (beta-lactamase class C family)